MSEELRESLGRVVREAWVKWAGTRRDPKPRHLAPYDQLSEEDKEADRQIGLAVFDYVVDHFNARRLELIDKKHRGGLGESEQAEFKTLQEGVFMLLGWKHPRPPSVLPKLEAAEKRLAEY